MSVSVEVIKRGLAAFATRDLETWRECFHPDVEVTEDSSIPGRFGNMFTVRAGQVVRWRIYASWADALEAAGLRE